MALDVIGAIEACYAPIPGDAAWTAHLCAAVAPLDRGLGLGAGVYDAADPAAPTGVALRPWGAARDAEPAFRALPPTIAARVVQAMFWSPPRVTTLSRKTAGLDPESACALREAFRGIGVPEAVGVFGADGPRGVLLAVYVERDHVVPARTRHQLSQLSAHLLAAYRLRRGGACSPDDARCEAVLEPSGHVRDARGAARDRATRAQLAAAVRRMEQARGRARRVAPEEAAALWRGLVDGTWTLVEHVESDGRRRILAVRAGADGGHLRGLTLHEQRVAAEAAAGRSNKHIAYELGLAPSTVASHLAHAARKLGVRSRQELVRAFGRAGR